MNDELFTTDSPVTDAPVAVEEKSGKDAKKKVAHRKKVVRAVPHGRAYIQSTYNNTMITLTDESGNALVMSSAGKCGFRGAKKSTAYAAGVVVRDAMTKAQLYGLKEVDVFVSGVGSGKDSAVRTLNAQGLYITAIKDVTPIPHNGCRPPKVRRV